MTRFDGFGILDGEQVHMETTMAYSRKYQYQMEFLHGLSYCHKLQLSSKDFTTRQTFCEFNDSVYS